MVPYSVFALLVLVESFGLQVDALVAGIPCLIGFLERRLCHNTDNVTGTMMTVLAKVVRVVFGRVSGFHQMTKSVSFIVNGTKISPFVHFLSEPFLISIYALCILVTQSQIVCLFFI